MRLRTTPTVDDVERLLRAMTARGTFYVLGAGASYGLVPTTTELRKGVKARYGSVGSYPVSRAAPSAMYDRVIGDIHVPNADLGEDPFADMPEQLLPNIPAAVLDMLVRWELVAPLHPITPPNYASFNGAAPGTIFSFNLDGLAPAYCGHRHHVLEPHGRVERELFESRAFAEMWEDLADYDLGVPQWTDKVLLRPEPQGLAESPVYRIAAQRLATARHVVIVGYSFSRFGVSRDDEVSLEFFGELLRQRQVPVIVIDPYPDEIADLIRDRARRNIVTAVPAKWDLLSAAIQAGVESRGYASIHARSADAASILRLYESLTR